MIFTVAELGQFAEQGVTMVARWSLDGEGSFATVRDSWNPHALNNKTYSVCGCRAGAGGGVTHMHPYAHNQHTHTHTHAHTHTHTHAHTHAHTHMHTHTHTHARTYARTRSLTHSRTFHGTPPHAGLCRLLGDACAQGNCGCRRAQDIGSTSQCSYPGLLLLRHARQRQRCISCCQPFERNRRACGAY
jgi:hypothetical protein